ncbi:MAG: SNF2 helicase associated domain-containing protein [Acidobacteria bacterium]|nr:SNF2 helicase associated domain-containing protein [Acidobacteriota bacterium]
MISLSQALRTEFNVGVRQRGLSYFQSQAVKIKKADQWNLTATVRGEHRYDVSLKRDAEGVITVCCSCPFIKSSHEPCKHLYAAILAAEDHKFLQGNGDNSDLVIKLEVEDDEDDFEEFEYDEEDEDEEDDLDFSNRRSQRQISQEARQRILDAQRARWGLQPAREVPHTQSPPVQGWQKALSGISQAYKSSSTPPFQWPAGREIIFVIDLPSMRGNESGIVIETNYRERLKNGEWGKLKALGLRATHIPHLPDALDRQVLTFLLGGREYLGYSYHYGSSNNRYLISEQLARQVLPLAAQTGRCWIRRSGGQTDCPSLHWSAEEPYEFWLDVQKQPDQYQVTGAIRRQSDQTELNLPDIVLITSEGLIFMADRVLELSNAEAGKWLTSLQKSNGFRVPLSQGAEFIEALHQLANTPKLRLPEELSFEEVTVAPHPGLLLRAHEQKVYADRVKGELRFDYGGILIHQSDPRASLYQAATRQLVKRDANQERAALELLQQLGFKEQRDYQSPHPYLVLKVNRVPKVIQTLLDNGWHVEAEGKMYRRPGNFNLSVSSGIDWFELHGTVDFEGMTVQLPELLEALKHGQTTVRLGDGTFGLLPEEWMKKYGLIAATGDAQETHIRFTKAQAGLLDALLAAQPEVTFDSTFARMREELKGFTGIKAQEPPAGFVGELRGYQKEALGWFEFLQKFGLGGCLADDMGLGKTPMTLALLESRRELRASQKNPHRPGPTLIVVPKSLVFNWQAEAARFTPSLTVLNHTGSEREKETAEHFDEYDIILTTYGTLRNDAILFKDKKFDYIVLDEAQAIKNANTESSKAARLLHAEHRLALSGTPIENHLGELWSLFDFLNPGLLGAASVFGLSGNAARNPEEETKQVLSQALRPFILRRTKSQVAKDLPAKLEQTIYCEMESEQTKLYNEIKQHYRNSLLGRIEREGINKSKMHILEALLRLRQAACHPGLLDPKKSKSSSAKLDVLFSQLEELADEGHKTLVFSQFTSFLAIVREHLDKTNLPYEYLDGQTHNRQERVERFQNDPNCKLFLISLKAGGVGLNLTAADYVFLLDPWWNPAVEAQAIDRTHRIGQTKQVFAYRLITRGTVEEKVLQLQDTKRDLADAIISANNSLIRSLNREDLELLLS